MIASVLPQDLTGALIFHSATHLCYTHSVHGLLFILQSTDIVQRTGLYRAFTDYCTFPFEHVGSTPRPS